MGLRRVDPLYVFAWGFGAVGVVAALAALALGGTVLGESAIGGTYLLLLACTIAGELFPLRAPTRDNDTHISASSLFSFSILIAFGLGPAAVAVVVASVLKDTLAHRPAVKVLFNASLGWLSIAAAALVMGALAPELPREGTLLHATEVPALLLAGATDLLVNSGACAIVVALATGAAIRPTVARSLRSSALTDGLLIGFAPVLVFLIDESVGLLVLVALPFLAVVDSSRKAARSEHMALHDSLTGLPNRVLFGRRTDEAITRAHHTGEAVTVLMLDLDRFKEVNDTLGHGVGDRLLEVVARRLRDAIGPDDLVARLGGDEFAFMRVLDEADPEAGIDLARAIVTALDAPVRVGESFLQINGSVGIACVPLHAQSAEELLQRADTAMFLAKQRRSQFEIYDSARDPNRPERLAAVSEIRAAIAAGQLVLHFHPKICLTTGRALGVESLARWQHPQRGLLGPGEFIPLIEESELTRPFTLAIARMAAAQAAAWHAAGIDLPVAFNVSGRMLADPTLADEILAIIGHAGVPAHLLEMEITESSLISDPDRTTIVLERLSAAGIRIAVDDFGTGYSSLALLKRLPVDAIKIDRSFITGMIDSPDDLAIVESTIRLARGLGLTVVAEGVETVEVLDQLGEFGCDQAQGFLICKPQPANELGWLLGGTPAAAAAARVASVIAA